MYLYSPTQTRSPLVPQGLASYCPAGQPKLQAASQGEISRVRAAAVTSRLLTTGVSLEEAIRADGRTFSVLRVEKDGEDLVASVKDDLTLKDVDEAVLNELGLNRKSLETGWRIAAGERGGKR